jgi:hypothetical protein
VDKRLAEFEVVAIKLKVAVGAASDDELAKALGVTATAYRGAKARRQLPLKHILSMCIKRKISLDWLFEVNKSNFLDKAMVAS